MDGIAGVSLCQDERSFAFAHVQHLALAKAQAVPKPLRYGYLAFFRNYGFHTFIVGIPTMIVKQRGAPCVTVVLILSGQCDVTVKSS